MSGVLDSFQLHGKIALVSGASRGIGAALARSLSEAGAEVHGFSRSDSATTDMSGDALTYHSCDICDETAVRDLVSGIIKAHGRIDILVNAAGISLLPGETDGVSDAFDRILDVNLVSAYRLTEEVLPHMSKCGSIINIGSLGSTLGFPENPGYVASKAGVLGLTRALATDQASKGIRVNCIIPGYIKTDMTAKSYSDPKLSKQRVDHTMLGRWGLPDDLAGAVVFLASRASSYITGTTLTIDGGWSAKGL